MENIRLYTFVGFVALYTAFSGCSGCKDKPKVGYDGVESINGEFIVQRIGTDTTYTRVIRPITVNGLGDEVIHIPLFNGQLDINHDDNSGRPLRKPHVHLEDASNVNVRFDFDNRRATVVPARIKRKP